MTLSLNVCISRDDLDTFLLAVKNILFRLRMCFTIFFVIEGRLLRRFRSLWSKYTLP